MTTKILITVSVEDDDDSLDPDDPTGLTSEAYDRLTLNGDIGWLGEVEDVRRA